MQPRATRDEPATDVVTHDVVQKSQLHLTGLINEVLNYARLETGMLSYDVRSIPEGGRVAIELLPQPNERGMAMLRVSDTGIGIPGDKLEAIFEPFVQIGRSLRNPGEGTGLGLAISRDLARAMGGDITAASELGRGATFTVYLPAGSPAAEEGGLRE